VVLKYGFYFTKDIRFLAPIVVEILEEIETESGKMESKNALDFRS
jgi:hypothetical protein